MLDIVATERRTNHQVRIIKITETGSVRFLFRADKEAVLRAHSGMLKDHVQAAYPNGHLRKTAIRKCEDSGVHCFIMEITVTFVQL